MAAAPEASVLEEGVEVNPTVAAAAAVAADAGSSSSGSRPRKPTFIADGRYEIKKKVGSGSYSDVHLGVDTQTGEQVAAKFEWTKAEKTNKLLTEAKLCQSFADCKHVLPNVRWVGTDGEYNIMVMDILGPSLEDLMDSCGGHFSVTTVLMLGVQMINLLEYVHSKGALHRDIKPNNFLIGAGDKADRVFVVDFGLAKKYLVPETGEHIPCNKKKGLTGTVRYTSMNVHRGFEPSRRDDLGGVGYVLMYFVLGRLPWQGITAKSKKTKQRRIGRRKEKTTHQELCKGYPDEFVQYLDYCDKLEYDAKPDYDFLRRLMLQALQRCMPGASHVEDVGVGGRPCHFDWQLPPGERAVSGKRKRPRSAAAEGEGKQQEDPTGPQAMDAIATAGAVAAAATKATNGEASGLVGPPKTLRVVHRLPQEEGKPAGEPEAEPLAGGAEPAEAKADADESEDDYEYDSYEEYEYDEDEEEEEEVETPSEEEEDKEGEEEEPKEKEEEVELKLRQEEDRPIKNKAQGEASSAKRPSRWS